MRPCCSIAGELAPSSGPAAIAAALVDPAGCALQPAPVCKGTRRGRRSGRAPICVEEAEVSAPDARLGGFEGDDVGPGTVRARRCWRPPTDTPAALPPTAPAGGPDRQLHRSHGAAGSGLARLGDPGLHGCSATPGHLLYYFRLFAGPAAWCLEAGPPSRPSELLGARGCWVRRCGGSFPSWEAVPVDFAWSGTVGSLKRSVAARGTAGRGYTTPLGYCRPRRGGRDLAGQPRMG